MSHSSSNIAKFSAAMRHVYRFPAGNVGEAEQPWSPPPATAGHNGRYLWTDAFGVLNFITLYKETSMPQYLAYAKSLVEAVHGTLGRTRNGKSLLRGATSANPLGGGLRIGKEDENGPDGDGQYHHYLTLWCFALNRLSLASGSKSYNDQAISLAKAIHPHFVYNRNSSRPRMYWKMSMDLSRPLVMSEGNLDPIDGYVVFRLLQQSDDENSESLKDEIADYKKIVRTKWQDYSSTDPLDLGMTLWTAHWFSGKESSTAEDWASGLVQRATRDLKDVFGRGYFDRLIGRRLAFREFGTCLGIRCATAGEDWKSRAEKVTDTWESTGVVPDPSKADSSAGHNGEDDLLPITLVMYAAALNPGAFCMGYV